MKLSPYRRWLLPVSIVTGAIAAFIPGCGTSNADHSGGGASSSFHSGGGSAVGGGESSGGASESVGTGGTDSSGGASQFMGTGGRESSGGASELGETGGSNSSGGLSGTGGSRGGTRIGSGGIGPTGGNAAIGGSRPGTFPVSGGNTASGGNLATGGSRVLQSGTGGVNTTGGTGGNKAAGGSSALSTGTAGGSVCTSKTTWRSGENPNMRPGEACITCHSSNPGAPKFVVAGTVYPTIHEPADCNGSNSSGSAKIIITDAQGVEHSISVNSAGNFMLEGSAIPMPYHARIEASTGTRSMGASQTSGDCNSCHTENGTNGAPGRIMLP